MKNLQRIIENTHELRTAFDRNLPSDTEEDKRSLKEKTNDLYKEIGKLGSTAAQMISMGGLKAIESRHPFHGIFGFGRQALPKGGYHDSHWMIIWIIEVDGKDEHQALIFDAEKKKAFRPKVDPKDKDALVSPELAVFTAGKVALDIIHWLVLEEDAEIPLVRTKGVSMRHDRLGEKLLADRLAPWFAACVPERTLDVAIDSIPPQDRLMLKNAARRGWIQIDMSEEAPKVATITWTDRGLQILERIFLN